MFLVLVRTQPALTQLNHLLCHFGISVFISKKIEIYSETSQNCTKLFMFFAQLLYQKKMLEKIERVWNNILREGIKIQSKNKIERKI
jgi:hypothetical protein